MHESVKNRIGIRLFFVLLAALLPLNLAAAVAFEGELPLHSFSFALITNTTQFANTVTINFWDPASVLATGKTRKPVCSRTKALAPGSTWILSSSSVISPVDQGGSKGFVGKACISKLPGDAFSYALVQNKTRHQNKPDTGAGNYALSLSGLPVEPVSAPSCSNCGVSIVFFGVDKKGERTPYSAHTNNIIDHATWDKESFKASMVNADKKIADAVVYKLNRRHVTPQNVVRVAVAVLESDSRIQRFIHKRAELHRTLVGQHSLEEFRVNASNSVTRKASRVQAGDEYWLGQGRGGDVYKGKHVCEPCLHALAKIRQTDSDLQDASRVVAEAQASIAKLKAKNTQGYGLQQKYRIKRQIKDIDQLLRQGKSRSSKLKRALKKAKIKFSNCKRKQC